MHYSYVMQNQLKSSEFKINAILDFARFLSSGCFVGDLGLFWVVLLWWFVFGVFCRDFLRVGGFCPGGFVRGGFVRWGLSGGFCQGGFCPGGFCPGRFCPGGFVRGVLSGGFCPGFFLSSGVLSTGGVCPSGGFVQRGFVRGVLSKGVLSTVGVCPRGSFVYRWVLSSGVLSGGFCSRIVHSTITQALDYKYTDAQGHYITK